MSDEKVTEVLSHLFKLTSSGWQDKPLLPAHSSYDQAEILIGHDLPEKGAGFDETLRHLVDDIVPGLNAGSLSPNYYGFVIGGVTPAAAIADNIVTAYDQNVALHMSHDTISTVVEDRALEQVLQLLNLNPVEWPGRTITTGATASNILGLACGREAVMNLALKRSPTLHATSVGDVGILGMAEITGIRGFQVLTAMAHSSLVKSASVVGLGRQSVKNVGLIDEPWRIDVRQLEEALKSNRNMASIVAVSCGEVNTGRFGTSGLEEMRQIRSLCDEYGAWLHVDGAFGLFARILSSNPDFEILKAGVEGMELADSIASDAHKLLNVPYDCGLFFCKEVAVMESVFQNPAAAYLSTGAGAATVPSAMNLGIENSRRFRALPVYATLMAHGRSGYREILERQVGLARGIAGAILQHSAYELLGSTAGDSDSEKLANIFMVVIFRAKNTALNAQLVKKINESSRIFVTGSRWEEKPATRIAVANWRVDVQRDLKLVLEVLDAVAAPS